MILHFYKILHELPFLLKKIKKKWNQYIENIEIENCFYIEIENNELLTNENKKIIYWLLSETFQPEYFSTNTFLKIKNNNNQKLIEIGPRLNFTTPWSTNAITIFQACNISIIKRIERSTRYLITFENSLNEREWNLFLNELYDKMTECIYNDSLQTFSIGIKPQPVYVVPILEKGEKAIEEINKEIGLAFDSSDITFYTNMFKELGRNPTTVELFDLSQSNSEHSRHWFFRGKLIIDNEEIKDSLMDIVKQTLIEPNNSILAFCDNSSAIYGYHIETLMKSSEQFYRLTKEQVLYHIVFTAETHNFPTGIAPKPGAETGIGGRIRDVHAVGRGGLVLAGTAGYCVGNLNISGYLLPWEDNSFIYPLNMASPLQIEINASNGASDYGNKFGEPIIQGFTRSFGLLLPNGERREWIKPIMFTGGIGQLDNRHIHKIFPQKGMLVVKIGGPAYRIGMGGGSASSLIIGENKEKLDFNAVQRGDAEMEQKLNRVIKACIELGEKNPIISIHDQGAGGTGNVIKEIIYPMGAKINIRKVLVGDETLSILEIWGAEYQENDALLIEEKNKILFENICKREHLPVSFIGTITGDGKIIVYDELDNSTPVNLDLDKVLGNVPRKIFKSERIPKFLQPLKLPLTLSIYEALGCILKMINVGCKLFLTNKVDRSVTGLIAQQQCVGPLQLPLSDVAVIAQSHFNITGAAMSIGEQPIKGLINTSCMARMTLGETLTNLMWAKISSLKDIKCSGNWMWAAKLPGEGAEIYDAAISLRDIMLKLGISIDGGKDSLSMASIIRKENGNTEIVKSPGTLVISAYVTCPDITKTITPDIKFSEFQTKLIFIDIANGKCRMGGSSLAYAFKQIGNESPDVDDTELLKRIFNVIQQFIEEKIILAGHDRSDGGLITTLLEMAFGGNCGIDITINKKWINSYSIIDYLFNEELGIVIEILKENEKKIISILQKENIPFYIIGNTCKEKIISIKLKEESKEDIIFQEDMVKLRELWNETSYQLELLQANNECIEQEKKSLKNRKGLQYHINFEISPTPDSILSLKIDHKPRVAIIREEGSNGDREMASAFYLAGFDVWDVTMYDLINKKMTLDFFNGIVFVGGFSYGDVLDSAKGWAGVIKFCPDVWSQFEVFYHRGDTFSLGVCNGCQLMALLGWIPKKALATKDQPRFIHNSSGRFESRFLNIKILSSPSIMLKGMENSILGIWISHGEGKIYFPNIKILDDVKKDNLAPIRYINDELQITEEYPFNPNGSIEGIAALCTNDGRHLAMMPHPERSILTWQWPYKNQIIQNQKHFISPWLKMFQNAREFCEKNKNSF